MTFIHFIDVLMQEDYVFDPAVITFDSIADGAVNTSFYRREGTYNTDSNLIVDQLLGKVSLIKTPDVMYNVLVLCK